MQQRAVHNELKCTTTLSVPTNWLNVDGLFSSSTLQVKSVLAELGFSARVCEEVALCEPAGLDEAAALAIELAR